MEAEIRAELTADELFIFDLLRSHHVPVLNARNAAKVAMND